MPNIANSITITGITFNINADKSVTANGTATADVSLKITDYLTFKESNYILSGCPKNGNSTTYSMVLEGTGRDTGNGATFTSATNKRVAIEIKNGVTVNNLVFKPMIAKGSQVTSYAPYFVPIQLCEIGDYQDYIYNNGGKWFIHKDVGKLTLNGTENWADNTSALWGSNSYGYTGLTYIKAWSPTFSNYFNDAGRTTGGIIGDGQIQMAGSGLVVRNTQTTTLADFKTWLETNTPEVYYVLATPIEEEITEPTLINQLNAIKYGAESYYGQTNIMITSEELQPTLKVQTLDKIV